MKGKVLVTGATGYLGGFLIRELLDNGYDVRAFARKPTAELKSLPIEIAIGDITDPKALFPAITGITGIFHIAALYRQAKFPDSVYWDVNYTGTLNVLNAAAKNNVSKIIHCSTVGVHSHIPNPPANENEPFRPADVYQESKAAGEKLVQEWLSTGKISGAIIRPALIWGDGEQRMLKLFKAIKRGIMPIIGSGETMIHSVLVNDLAKAFRLAYEAERANGNVYIIAGEKAVTINTLIKTVADALDARVLPIRIPALPFQIIGDIVEGICKPFGIEPPIHRRRADFFTKTRSFDTSKAKNELGFAPSVTFEQEVNIVAESYKKLGWV